MTSPADPLQTARIAEWDRQKGFGYLQVGKQRLFLHRRDFVEHHKRPAVGDIIRFTIGRDAKGRPCATNASHANDGGRIHFLTISVMAGPLVLPVIALHQRGVPYAWIAGYFAVLGFITYRAYAADKKRARAKHWRISEQVLHLLELFGGWPGALLAQRALRHKCSKGSYQFIFWGIILVYQFGAFDSLNHWELSRGAVEFIVTARRGK